MKLPEFSVRQPVATLMVFCAVILMGTVSLLYMSTDMFPDVEPPVITVITTWPGANASDVETEVTDVIENQLNGVANLDSITSKSMDNISLIACKFEWESDLDVASNDIRDRLEFAKKDLPADIDPPMLFKFSSATAPILMMTVTGEKSWPRLHHIVDNRIADELKRVPGVGAVMLVGGLVRRINVDFDPERLEGYNLSVQQVNQVLSAQNLNIPAGSIKAGGKEYFLRVPGRYTSPAEIGETIVGSYGGRPVRLRDVATVGDSYEDETMYGWGNGKRAIAMVLQKQTGANTVEVVRAVKKKLDSIRQNLPSDVRVNINVDSSATILNSIANLRKTLIEAIVIVAVVTVAFLRRVRTSFIICTAIPFSLIAAFIVLYLFGYTVNMVLLMSMAIAVGMVVDDAIVILENIVRHLERGAKPALGSIFGAGEMGMAVTASTFTVAVVFIPLIFVSGLTGVFFKVFAITMVVTILASLFSSLTMTPMLASRLLSGGEAAPPGNRGLAGVAYRASERWFEALEQAYGRLLAWALAHTRAVVVTAVVVFGSGLALVPFLATSFVPQMDTGDITIGVRMPEGTRIEETKKVIEGIHAIVGKTIRPGELLHVFSFCGQTKEGFGEAVGFEEAPNAGQVFIKLVDRQERSRSAKEIANELRRSITGIPGISSIKILAQDPMTSVIMGGQKPIVVEIQGDDLKECLAYASRLGEETRSIPGVIDLTLSQKNDRPELQVRIDRTKASTLGLTAGQVAAMLRNYYHGQAATSFWDTGERYDIYTRYTVENKNDPDELMNAPLFTSDGRVVRLANVATITDGSGPVEIQRKNRQKIVRLEADIYKRELGEVTADIKAVMDRLGIPPGLSARFGSDVEEQAKAFKDLSILMLLGVVLVYMVLASLYGNLRDPLIIMFSVPFGIVGVVYAFFLFKVPLDLMTFMGVVMLSGIVVKNAIVLLDYTHLLLKRGRTLEEAVTTAGSHRLRPILMTTLTTVLGMVPMALSKGQGAEFWNPLGITMISGLSVSTLITLVLIPTVFYGLESRKQGRKAS
ncbi:MAG TPA: efflux RND transporter permease subunit [Deltaproteobacteria bacterium]|nr:efflux RND transporter permease subunit [Deltaproteobacteria bacterium]HOM28614.1 efflux RND transporter permease subunit [Deltaproteobacteria bacterium]HPP81086.1 efflux RND transporter permease subunit [Deltaproteobacteria bacterium]